MAELACRECGDTAGPWEPTPDGPVCEDCLAKDGAQ